MGLLISYYEKHFENYMQFGLSFNAYLTTILKLMMESTFTLYIDILY